jgi:hypothetical protein
MSMKMLRQLQGDTNGAFKKYLDEFDELGREPRIAWYPSAGKDFKALTYLSAEYSAADPASGQEPIQPDLFLYTDYQSGEQPFFLSDPTVKMSDGFTFKVKGLEQLPDLNTRVSNKIIHEPSDNPFCGQVFFMQVEGASDSAVMPPRPVLYIIGENESFCAQTLLANKARISHIVHVRYGGGCGGGGHARGSWLLNVLKPLGCEVFVSDPSLDPGPGDLAAIRLYPALGNVGDRSELKEIRRLDGALWSNYGDVSWFKVQ